MIVSVSLSNDRAKLPAYMTSHAAGADLFLAEAVEIAPGEVRSVTTAIRSEFPEGFVALIFERSSFSRKTGCSLANKVGVIDADYRGNWQLQIRNDAGLTLKDRVLKCFAQIVGKPFRPSGTVSFGIGERVGQVVFVGCERATFVTKEDLSTTARGENGFGSTGQ